MKSWLLPLLLLAPLCSQAASTPKEIKTRFSQFKVGDKTICLDEVIYADNKKNEGYRERLCGVEAQKHADLPE